jgi:hypothetical protein
MKWFTRDLCVIMWFTWWTDADKLFVMFVPVAEMSSVKPSLSKGIIAPSSPEHDVQASAFQIRSKGVGNTGTKALTDLGSARWMIDYRWNHIAAHNQLWQCLAPFCPEAWMVGKISMIWGWWHYSILTYFSNGWLLHAIRGSWPPLLYCAFPHHGPGNGRRGVVLYWRKLLVAVWIWGVECKCRERGAFVSCEHESSPGLGDKGEGDDVKACEWASNRVHAAVLHAWHDMCLRNCDEAGMHVPRQILSRECLLPSLKRCLRSEELMYLGLLESLSRLWFQRVKMRGRERVVV